MTLHQCNCPTSVRLWLSSRLISCTLVYCATNQDSSRL